MAILRDLLPTTELEAVNDMLAATGEAPVESLDTPTLDVEIALSTLKASMRRLMTRRWRFNSEHGLEVAPSYTHDWTDRNGNTTTLNIFTPPAGAHTSSGHLLDFKVTAVPWQQGRYYLDLAIRESVDFLHPDSKDPVKVFYDRTYNRDGLPHEYIYIDPVWLLDFEDIPQVAKNYVTMHAARMFAQRMTGDSQISGFTERDEVLAFRDLKKSEGVAGNPNIFDNQSVTRIMGNRPPGPAGFSDWRGTTGRA